MTRNFIALLQEFPFPSNNGMRSDIARRLHAWSLAGHSVHAISWTGGRLDPDIGSSEIGRAQAVTSSLEVLPIDRSPRRMVNMLRFPSQVAGRWPKGPERHRLLEKYRTLQEAVDFVWVDGIHATALGQWLARQLGVPLLYRSHNIEHRYLREQARLASGRDAILIGLNVIGMKRTEKALFADAETVFDISSEDRDYWQSEGFPDVCWLPPLADPEILQYDEALIADPYDLLFFGSLSSPNNRAAIRWYLEQIHPLVQNEIPDIRLLVAGRSPSPELVREIGEAGGKLLADPVASAPVYAMARVMINPIRHGSGVNIKTIDMLASGRPTLTTPKGARALPTEAISLLKIYDNAEGFAAGTIEQVRRMRAKPGGGGARNEVARIFGTARIAEVMADTPQASVSNR